MGFLSGSTTFQRYWITKDPTSELGADHIETLKKFQVDKREKKAALDEPQTGFVAGAHLLDTGFALEKNILEDVLHFGVRVDSDQIPAAVRNAWLQMELAALTVDNPSGKPTKAQRKEAKEMVEARCLEEAATGKFRRMAQTPVLWDAQNDMLYVGSSSSSANEWCVSMMERAFGLELEAVSSGKLAAAYASEFDVLDSLYRLKPTSFRSDEAGAGQITWWNGMAENYDYLGNEFLVWLWWKLENEDQIQLSDESMVQGLFARTLTLDCPLGESGKETISAESPVVLPEALLALQSGKLPRKAGLTLVRQGDQADFALQAEAFSVGSAKLSKIGDDSGAGDEFDRITDLRAFVDTLDLLYDVFCERRIGNAWKKESSEIREWLHEEQVPRKTAA